MMAISCKKCGAQLSFQRVEPGMKLKCLQCGAIFEVPEAGQFIPGQASPSSQIQGQAASRALPIIGGLSLLLLFPAIVIGVLSTIGIVGRTEEMSSIGAIAGLGFGCVASIPSLVLGVLGWLRGERPVWPAVCGTLLSAVPAAVGIWVIIKLILP